MSAGVNTYAYAGLNPILYVDPDGRIVKEIIVIGAVVVTIYGVYSFFEEYREAADAALRERRSYEEILDALADSEPLDEKLVKEYEDARRQTLNETLDLIKTAPPGTSITGPASNPLNKSEAAAILIQEGLKSSVDQARAARGDAQCQQ